MLLLLWQNQDLGDDQRCLLLRRRLECMYQRVQCCRRAINNTSPATGPDKVGAVSSTPIDVRERVADTKY